MSKKPAKKGPSSTPSAPVVDDGRNVLYVGLGKTIFHECPQCGKSTRKGVVREYRNTTYCSVGCVRDFKKKEEA